MATIDKIPPIKRSPGYRTIGKDSAWYQKRRSSETVGKIAKAIQIIHDHPYFHRKIIAKKAGFTSAYVMAVQLGNFGYPSVTELREMRVRELAAFWREHHKD